jgi:predicted dinucleotide-binding enzyme
MAANKTIAIIGATEKNGIDIATRFAQINARLLLVTNKMEKLPEVLEMITRRKPIAEIDTAECVKDGCWEADIILLAVEPSEENKVAEMMKEVATQKIVVSISDKELENESLQQILPHSKLVKVSNVLSKEIFIAGEDEEANEEILNIFLEAGYYPVMVNESFR